MAELKLWTNDFDLIVAESAEEATQIFRQSDHYDPEDQEQEDELFEPYSHATINWYEECGSGKPVKMTVQQLVDKLGKGYAGITEC
jgi:hypothetical protein